MRNCICKFRSEDIALKVNDTGADGIWDPIAGVYPAKDGWLRLVCSLTSNFRDHDMGVMISCPHILAISTQT